MSRNARLAFLALSAFLLLLPLTLAKPGLPVNLKADEPAYYLMALSLVRDWDLRLGVEDVDRIFEEFPLVPVRNLIVMSDDGWRTIYYSKPVLYPLFGAPFAALFGANGLLFFNMLMVVGMVWMGARHLERFGGGGLPLPFAAGFVVLSSGFAYAFWLHTEVFNMAAVCLAYFLVFSAGRPGARPSEAGESPAPDRGRRAPGQWVACGTSGAALALAVYNKPMYGLLALPLLFVAWRRRGLGGATAWAAGGAVVMAGTMGLSLALTERPTPYLGTQLRAGVSICESGVLPLEPIPRPPAAVAGQASEQQPRPINWGFILLPRRFDVAELAENLGYFLWGRHTGFLLYLPFGVLCVLLFALEASKDPERWLLLGALAGLALYFLVFVPVNWQGGGGFIGNRYYVGVYPAFLFLVRRIRPAALLVPATGAAGLFLGPLLLSPFGAAVPEPTLQAHVRNYPFRLFPLELSLKNVPGYHRIRLDGGRMLARRDQITPRGESLWLRGSDRVEVWLELAQPLDRHAFLVESFAPGNVVQLEMGSADETVTFSEAGQAARVILDPEKARRRRSRGEAKSWVYRLVVRSSSGAVEAWTRRLGRRSCGSFETDTTRRESFFAGVKLTWLGDADYLQSDVWELQWGSVEAPAQVEAGALFPIRTVVTNRSSDPWTEGAGSASIHLSYHWLDEARNVVLFDGRRTDLGRTVRPGETLRVEQEIEAPPAAGSYILELDPVFEHVAWFSERNGGDTYRTPVEVVPAGEGAGETPGP